MSRDTKKGRMAAKKCAKHFLKVIDRFIIYLMLIHANLTEDLLIEASRIFINLSSGLM